jgi:hypothetical protein
VQEDEDLKTMDKNGSLDDDELKMIGNLHKVLDSDLEIEKLEKSKRNRSFKEFKGYNLAVATGWTAPGSRFQIKGFPEFFKKIQNGEPLSQQELEYEKKREAYYTIDLRSKISPDMIVSITQLKLVDRFIYGYFKEVILENIDCNVFLDPQLYKNLQDITAPYAKIIFNIAPVCLRTAMPVMKKFPGFWNPIRQNYLEILSRGKEEGGSFEFEKKDPILAR